MKEVYIGNGRTINVEEHKDFTNYLDIEKLKKIVEENKGKKILVGASSDWYWTAQEIKEDTFKPYNQSLLRASSWDSFKVEINEDETIDVTIKVPQKECNLVYENGWLKGIYKIEFWLPGIYTEIIKNLEYEKIKELQAEILPILEKYKNDTKSTK